MLRHNSTYDFSSQKFEDDFSDSLTEPDQSYTIKELLQRFGVGNTPPIDRSVYFDEQSDEDATLDGISPTESGAFDLADATALAAQLAENRRRWSIARDKFRQQAEQTPSSDSKDAVVNSQNVTTTNDDAN